VKTSHDRRPRILAVADVAHRLDVSTKTVRRWIEQGDLRVHRLGRQLRISEEDLSAFINRGRV
jgi:excisionase family DNA binding protein